MQILQLLLHPSPFKRHRIMPLRLTNFRRVLVLPYSCRSTSSSRMAHVDINKSDGTSNDKQEASVSRTQARRVKLCLDGVYKHLGYAASKKPPNASGTASNNKSCSLSAINDQQSLMDVTKQARTSSDMLFSCSKQPEHSSVVAADHENKCSLPSGSGKGSLNESELLVGADCTHMLEKCSLPSSFGKPEPPQSKKPKFIKHKVKDGCSNSNGYPKNKSYSRVEVFDICQSAADDLMILKSPGDFLDETKDPEVDKLDEEPRERVLRPGMILFKRYISDSDQVSIVRKCRELGIGPGGFYRPGYKYGAKLRLHMMCLGLDWDPQTRKYQKQRQIDRSKPPDIPPEFYKLVDRAMLDSLALITRDFKVANAEDILPHMRPDICIINFYSETGRLGLHQDRDESTESLTKGLPVVSFSVGDSAEFLYGDQRDPDKAENLILESGDVLIFGGQARHVFHGVASIIPNSAPRFLVEETGLLPGRLNLTFRQY